MAEENEPIEIAPKSNRILFCYFLVVLLLGLIAVGILFRTFDTAFVEKEKWEKVAESQKRPNRLILPGRGNIYSSDACHRPALSQQHSSIRHQHDEPNSLRVHPEAKSRTATPTRSFLWSPLRLQSHRKYLR